MSAVDVAEPIGSAAIADGDGDPALLADKSASGSPVPWIAVISAIGVLVVAVGFARGRANEAWSAPMFWTGETIVLGLPAFVLVNRRTVEKGDGVGIAMIVAIATYIIKVCYQPLQFTFSDEFQHMLTIQPILSSHHLFHANPTLTVSPYYPGLEIVTSSVAQMSHLSTYSAAVVVLGSAHLVTTLGLYFLVLQIVPRPRVAGLAVLIFAMGGNYQFFTTYFAYESLGLPLVIMATLSVVKSLQRSSRSAAAAWMVLGVLCGFGAAITHHVSSYALIGIELSVAIVYLLSAARPICKLLAVGAVSATAGFVLFWDLIVATPTFGYLRQALVGQFSSSSELSEAGSAVHIFSGGAFLSINGMSQVAPTFQHYAGYFWALALTLLLGVGLRQVLLSSLNQNPLLWAMALLAPGIVIAFVLQVLAPGGAQIGTRLLTFLLIPASLICALGIEAFSHQGRKIGLHSRSGHYRGYRKSLVNVAIVPFVLGAIALGYPPYYAAVPGPYLLGGRSRAVDAYNLRAALWARQQLGKGNRFASDIANAQVLDSIGQQINVNSIASTVLILSSKLSTNLEAAVRPSYLVFVVADSRITSSIPVAGNPIFPNDPFTGHYVKRIPVAAVEKFDSVPGVSRMYDNGPIVIYNVKGSAIAPAARSK